MQRVCKIWHCDLETITEQVCNTKHSLGGKKLYDGHKHTQNQPRTQTLPHPEF